MTAARPDKPSGFLSTYPSKKIALFAALFILALFLVLFGIRSVFQETVDLSKKHFNEQQQLLGEQICIGIKSNLAHLVRELELLSQKDAIVGLEPENSRKAMEETFQYERLVNVNDVALLDTEGRVLTALKAPQLEGKNFAFREYFKRAKGMTHPSPAIEAVTFQGVDAGQKGIIIAMPVFSGKGRFGGVVLFTLKIDQLLGALLPDRARTEGQTIWVLDNDGQVLSHPELPPGTLVSALPQADESFKKFINALTRGRVHSGEYLSPAGMLVLASATPLAIGDSTWAVILSAPLDRICHLLSRITLYYNIGFFCILLICMGATLTLQRFFRNWNRTLQAQILEKEQIEKNLRISEKRFRGLFNQAADSIFLLGLGPEGLIIVDANDASFQMHGYARPELLGLPIKTLDAPGTAEKVDERTTHLMNQRSLTFEGEHVRKNGSIFPVEISARTLNLEDNEYVISIVRDISERKKSETALRNAHQELELRVRDRTKDLQDANEHLKMEISNRRRVETVLRSLAQEVSGAIGDDFFQSSARFLIKTLDIDYVVIGRLSRKRSDIIKTLAVNERGDLRPNFRFSLEGSPLETGADHQTLCIPENAREAFPRDELLAEKAMNSFCGITLVNSSGQRLGLILGMGRKHLGDPELSRSVFRILATRTAAELEREDREHQLLKAHKLESIGRLSAGIAHEINNPLTNASLNIQLIKKKFPEETVPRDLWNKFDAIERNIDRAATIAKELLTFSRQQEIKRVPTDMNTVITKAITLLTYGFTNITVRRMPTPIPEILGDPLKLEGLIINILNNATEAMPEGGTLTIATRVKDHQVVTEITDTGTGIAKENLARVFDPFFTTKDVGAGTGLGLSICHGIVKQHRGTIELFSTPGEGTRVTITLPAYEVES